MDRCTLVTSVLPLDSYPLSSAADQAVAIFKAAISQVPAAEELVAGGSSVSATGAVRSTSSELRAAVPGPSSCCTGCIAAAAASGQTPGALHAEGRVGPGRQSPPSSHGSGARAWTAPPAAGRSLWPARLASVPPSGCECCWSTPSPAGCYLIPG